MKLNREIFRGFSVRGVVGRDLDVERMAIIGKATGSWLQRQGSHNLVIGHDVRLSSPQLHQALIRGILETGTDVIDIGQTPTPLLNFAVDYYRAAGGVMVTASHNPQDYNGLKIRTARTIYGDDLQQIYEIAEKGEFISGAGKYKAADPTSAYSEALSRRIELRRPLHVVVDGGNGMNGLVVPPLLRKAGCWVSEIFCDPDGSFPNRDPDPGAKGAMQALTQTVLREKADLGMAFDGDGDRVILVDDAGQTILGDTALMLLARQELAWGNPIKVVYEVLCSQAVPDDILSHGGEAIAAPSGYAFVHNALLASGATLGGEMAGHFFLLDDEFRFDDAILAAVRLVSLISCQTLPLSKLVSQLPHYHSSHEFRLPCPDTIKSKIVAEMAKFYRSRYPIDTIDGVRVLFGDGSALIRQSNTQPVLSLRFEAKTSIERLESIQEEVLLQVRDCYRQFGLEWPAS